MSKQMELRVGVGVKQTPAPVQYEVEITDASGRVCCRWDGKMDGTGNFDRLCRHCKVAAAHVMMQANLAARPAAVTTPVSTPAPTVSTAAVPHNAGPPDPPSLTAAIAAGRGITPPTVVDAPIYGGGPRPRPRPTVNAAGGIDDPPSLTEAILQQRRAR